MENSEIVKKLFTKRELERNLQKSYCRMQKNLKRKDYSVAAFYSFDVARIHQLLGETKKAKYHYKKTLEYVEQSEYQWIGMRQKCLIALGRSKEALEIALTHTQQTKYRLANLYEEIGVYDLAQKLYSELAEKHSRKADESTFFQSQRLQYASDLWEKARNMEKACKYNQRAIDAWGRISSIDESLASIEEAWLYEEIGYIYQKADQLETAINYYRQAWDQYKRAYTEDVTATGAHQVDGDWDFYTKWFAVQIPENVIFKFRSEHPMKYDQRRMKYRKLTLKEKN